MTEWRHQILAYACRADGEPWPCAAERQRDVLVQTRNVIRTWQTIGHRITWAHPSTIDFTADNASLAAAVAADDACRIGPCAAYNRQIDIIDAVLSGKEEQ